MSRNSGDASSRRRKPRIDVASVAGDIKRVDSKIAAITTGDYAGVMSQAHDNVELQVFAPRKFSWISHARGRSAITAAFEHNARTVEVRHSRLANMVSQGDVVLLFGSERGRIRGTGEAYDVDFVHRFTFRDGRLASVRIIAACSARALRFGESSCAVESRKTA